MLPTWTRLTASQEREFRTAVTFLQERLAEHDTVNWALDLTERDIAKRAAVLYILEMRAGIDVREPWRSAWRLIEESWKRPIDSNNEARSRHTVASRVRNGERTGSLISTIVSLVMPAVEVRSRRAIGQRIGARKPKPQSHEDIIHAGLTSGELIEPAQIALNTINDEPFLEELAHELDAAVQRGLDISRRIGLGRAPNGWHIGEVRRVYFLTEEERPRAEHEPDQFATGLAPSVKLLYAVVARLAKIRLQAAQPFARRWQAMPAGIYLRLWAALARDATIATSKEVADFLTGLPDSHFWNLHVYPEIAEIRARRFSEFSLDVKEAVLRRIRKGPPRTQWPRKADRQSVSDARVYWTARELRRIQIAGAQLDEAANEWLDSRLGKFADLTRMSRVDEGFLGTPKARAVPSMPDEHYEIVAGTTRLQELQEALRTQWQGFHDPARGAADWINKQTTAEKLVADFEGSADAGVDYPSVWERFLWSHSPSSASGDVERPIDPEVKAFALRVLALLERLPVSRIDQVIDAATSWLANWSKHLRDVPSTAAVWFRLWPRAVAVTNATPARERSTVPGAVTQIPEEGHVRADGFDALNNAAGRLIGVFLSLCPNLKDNPHPFTDPTLRAMRDLVTNAAANSGLIARYRMIESLGWFLRADPDWAQRELIVPLLEDSDHMGILWRAVGRRTHPTEDLEIIGDAMVARAVDLRLSRDTRKSLVFSLGVDSVHAFREERPSAVPNERVQQMLRSLDDEVRAHAAQVPQQFIRELSKKGDIEDSSSPEALFRSSVQPFLQLVWPQERSFARPGIARAFADLPASCGGEFAAAVDAVERFLVPFDCWSLLDYGLYGDDDGHPKLLIIDDEAKAAALLRLLDTTISSIDGAIVPSDLGDALDRVRHVVPKLAEEQSFRRLTTLTRR